MEVRKAVIGVAGFGYSTICRQQSRSQGALPHRDKPIVQYLVAGW